MKLHQTAASPYVRKTRMAIAVKGLTDQVTCLETLTTNADDPLHKSNPLGKIPTLVLDDGTTLYDSRVICEYIDSIGTSGPRLFPEGESRWQVLTLLALGDGICDAALLAVYEKRYRPENMWYTPWIDKQMKHIHGAADALEKAPPAMDGTPHIGHISLAAALGYLDFRLEGFWRQGRPNLVAWLDNFAAAVPAFKDTAPQ